MSEPSGYSLSDATAGSYWYSRIDGKEDGPYSTGRLRQLARQGRLLPEDEVRLGKIGVWVSAGEVEGLFRGIAPTTRAQQAAAAETQARQAKAEAGRRSPPSGELGRTVRYWAHEVVGWVGGTLESLRLIVSWVCLGIVVITLAVLLGRNISWDWATSRLDPYVALTTDWSELKSLRDAEATDDQWDEFATRSKTRLVPVIEELERKAGADDRYSQQLLWAARDIWPTVLADARSEPSPAESRFGEHLSHAQMVQQGQPLYPSVQRTGGSAEFDSNIFMRLYGDWLTAGIVLVDGILFLVFIRWWSGRRR